MPILSDPRWLDAWRAVFHDAPEIVACFDAELRQIYANRPGTAGFDLEGTAEDEVALPAAQAAEWRGKLKRVLESGTPAAHQFTIDTPYGVRRFEASLAPVKDRTGAAVGVISISRDITDTHALHLLEAAVRRLPIAVSLVEAPSGRLLLRNPPATAIFRIPESPMPDISAYRSFVGFHPDGREYTPEEWPLSRSIITGEIVSGEVAEILRGDGTRGFITMSSAPVRDSSTGTIIAGLVTFEDITGKVVAEQRQRLLADAAAVFSSSLDTSHILAEVARLTVPAMADWTIVNTIEDGGIRTVAVEHVDPGKRDIVSTLSRRYFAEKTDNGVYRVLHGGPAELYPTISDEMLAAAALDAAHLASLREVGYRSAMVVPMAGHGGVLGSLTFVTGESERQFDEEDLHFAEELARRAALAFETARLYEAEQRARHAAEYAAERVLRLQRLGIALTASATPRDVAHALGRDGRRALEADASFVWLADAAGREFELASADGADRPAAIGGERFSINAPVPATDALATGWPVLLDSPPRLRDRYPHLAGQAGGFYAWATIPILLDQRPLGAVTLAFHDPRRLDRADEVFMMAVAAQAAQAIDRARLLEAERVAHAEAAASAARATAAYAVAKDAERRKDEFLAMLGHELRNPLAPILTALQLMRLKGDPASAREREVIGRQVDHLRRLVGDLLDVSRITRGKITLNIERLLLGDVIRDAVELASPLVEERKHSLELDVPAQPIEVEGDRTRLSQIVTNLLTNAAKYTPAGGTIRVAARRASEHVRVSVSDTGIGIPKHMLEAVFDLFTQGDRTIDRGEGGLGLGLALVRRLTELHGGVAWAESDGPGRGSTFVVEFPTAAGSRLRSGDASGSRPAATTPRRILVVDDNTDAAAMMAAALRQSGHQVAVAHDAVRALTIAGEYQPDCALLDIGLPVVDGYELALRLRQQLPAITLIAITGYGQQRDLDRGRAAGFVAHLVKPVDIEQLLHVMAAPHASR